jgi:hypothetical protein
MREGWEAGAGGGRQEEGEKKPRLDKSGCLSKVINSFPPRKDVANDEKARD